MQLRYILTSIALLGALIGQPGHAQASTRASASASERGDAAILEMGQAFNRGNGRRLTELLPQARGHVLEPWAAYWDLRLRLDTASTEEIQAFLTRYAGTYQEDRLRNDWLLQLGKRRDWTQFALAMQNYRMNDDREVRCYALPLAPAPAGVDIPAEIKRLWYSQKEQDDGCSLAVGGLYAIKKLSENDIWRKVRLALEADRPRAARAAAEIISPQAGAAVDEISSKPARFLDGHVVALRLLARERVLLALIRLAATEPDLAASKLENHWSVDLSPEQRSWAWGVIGKQAALRLSPRASDYFSKAKDSDLSDVHLAWKVRAALRQGQWKVVLPAIRAMSEETRRDPTWIYWQARALKLLARTDAERNEARLLLESIAGIRGFYEQLALEELGQLITVPQPPPALSAEEKQAARSNPGLTRALYAIGIGLRSEGVREWNYSTNLHQSGGMSDRELLAAADLACQHEVWDRCINTSERTKGVIDFNQRYPMPHKEALLRRTAQIELDPAYVYGLIRQESRFVMDSHSSVGAAGLMQIMPATARWTAKKLGISSFKPEHLTDSGTNIAIGTGYLKLILDNFGGSMPLAAAAYNAGPNRPRNWRGQSGAALEAAIWMENVPFTETRDYVKKVLSNTASYAALISGQPQSLKSRLGLIGPRDARSAAPENDLP